MTEVPPKCPLCPRVRRKDRPVCNNHMRKAGQPLLDTYFVWSREARGKPADSPEVRVLGAVIDAMLESCKRYDDIKARGYRPHWNVAGERWEHPRERARDILDHRLAAMPGVDAQLIDSLADALVPRLP